MTFPFGLIFLAYGLSALAGILAGAAGSGWPAALALFWLGGSAALFALPAALPALRRAEPAADPFMLRAEAFPAGDAAARRAAMLAEWAADLEAETAAARPPRRRAG
ncbi:MAG: hypothetical protein KatS3mg118_3424 [Paracoccaceae bacterium]|nr:MAG: hypothetical protein KatS3mg118_3424 [Paracoccaceae bacterium]